MINLTENHLNCCVLISLGNSNGSGFLYRTDSFVYLVTAKHVILDESDSLRVEEIEIRCQSLNSKEEDIRILKINLKKIKPQYDYNSDVVIIKFSKVKSINTDKSFQGGYLEGVEIIQKGRFKPIAIDRENIKLLEDVKIANDIYVFGYPTSIGIPNSMQFDPTKPLLRKGIVANINEKEKTIILDCPVYGGNSGGPVVQIIDNGTKETISVIGVVSQYIPYVQKWKSFRDNLINTEYLNSGYSVASPFDLILKLIEDEA